MAGGDKTGGSFRVTVAPLSIATPDKPASVSACVADAAVLSLDVSAIAADWLTDALCTRNTACISTPADVAVTLSVAPSVDVSPATVARAERMAALFVLS